MIEITFTEMVLVAWAVLATAAAFKFRGDVLLAKRVFMVFVENREAREQLLKSYKEFKGEQT